MKRWVLTGIVVFLFEAFLALPVYSQLKGSHQNSANPTDDLTPSALVSLAYQGYFAAQGIPSNGGLIMARSNNRIHAEDLVKSAIAQNRLPTQVLENQDYLNAVEQELDDLEREFNH